ncbi:MAG: FtsQ-type POTRA domain-containing protein [Firmicutes bacterium]|nr:FtsQ-type POTRA domain-containing protein [Bacillota bacterium]
MKQEEKQKKKKRRRYRRSPLRILIGLIGIAFGVFLIVSTSYFNVQAFKVTGNSYYSAEEILVMGNCKTGGNIFWGGNLKDIEERLEKDPYMGEVEVKRVLPDTIQIDVKERVQIASIVYGQHFVVVDKDGRVLRNTEVDPRLTQVHGLTISKIEVGQLIEVEQSVKLRQTLEMLTIMSNHDMYFTNIELTKSGVNAYVLDTLVCQGTPQNIMEAIKVGNLQKVVAGLFEMEIERGTITISGGDYISFNPALS